jgi:hypothetical protein
MLSQTNSQSSRSNTNSQATTSSGVQLRRRFSISLKLMAIRNVIELVALEKLQNEELTIEVC